MKQLLLQDLLKYTPRDHGDFDLLLRTSQAVSDLLKSINQGPAEVSTSTKFAFLRVCDCDCPLPID